jgi:hypothetical protein
MLWSTVTILAAVVAFETGWFLGYKKASYAYCWHLRASTGTGPASSIEPDALTRCSEEPGL